MANPEHEEVLRTGVAGWNRWREENPGVRPDLSGPVVGELEQKIAALVDAVGTIIMRAHAPPNDAPFSGVTLVGANLSDADMARADFSRSVLMLATLEMADLRGASLAGAILTSANLRGADLAGANLSGAMLRGATLSDANLSGAILTMADLASVQARGADFENADLTNASLVGADLTGANLTGAHVFGISAWNVGLSGAVQEGLSITRANEPAITIDDLRVAQFLYLILNNATLRDVIDTITTKLVLLLGRFTPDRKVVLDALRRELRGRGYVPILFDFDRPSTRDFTETVVTLAHMARFMIADLTDPASLPKELEAIVPRLAVPLQPLIQRPQRPYAMFADYWKYDWVLQVHEYSALDDLLPAVGSALVPLAEQKAHELLVRRASLVPR